VWNAAVVALAVVLAWLCTIPAAIALINWDNAAYIAEMASGGYDWSHLPWSTHLGLGQEYKIGVWLAQVFGGTVIDGFRVVSAVAFAAACWLIFDTGWRVSGARAPAAVLTALWVTTWVNFHYHLILEDNFLFLAPCAAMLRICVLRVDDWRRRDSLLCGMFCLLALLGSYQAAPYIFAAAYAALLGPGRSWLKRLRDAALIGAGFVGSMLLWMSFTVATSRLSWRVLAGQVLMGPTPNFMPHSASELFHYLLAGRPFFEMLGNGVFWNLSFHAYRVPWEPPLSRFTIGLLTVLFFVGVFAGTTWWAWRRRRFAPHVITATLLVVTFLSSIHQDDTPYIGLKRYDFLSLFLVFLAASLLGRWRRFATRRALARSALAIALLVASAQGALGLRWTVQEQARYVTTQSWNQFPHPEPMQYGREGKSWFRYFRDLDREHRKACTLVLSYGEIADSTWNFDILGSLYSEVHSHLVVADDDMIATFQPRERRVVPHLVRAKEARIPACAWVSPAAGEVLAKAR
jgi:hypothetical protein